MMTMLRMKITFIYLCLYTLWSMAWVYKLGFTRNLMGGLFGYVLLTISYAAVMYFDVLGQQHNASRSSGTAQGMPKTTKTRATPKGGSTAKGDDDTSSKTRPHVIERSSFEDNALDLTPYMNEKAFNGFDEGQKNNFYTVYAAIIEKLIAEERPHVSDADYNENEVPRLGGAEDTYDEVVAPFYAYWSAFSTHKKYDWLPEITEADENTSRTELRAIERDNKKVMDAARRERNEHVQAFVAFIRRHDPRIVAHREELERQREQAAEKAEEHRRRQIQAHNEAAGSYQATAWDQDNEDALAALEKELDEEEFKTRKRKKQRRAD